MAHLTDDQITSRLRAELEAFTSGISDTPPAVRPPSEGATMTPKPDRKRWIASGLAAAAVVALIVGLVVAAGGSDDQPAAPADSTTESSASSATESDTVAVTSPPATVPLTAPTIVDGLVEGVGTVIERADGTRLCFSTRDANPPQCNVGIDVEGWTWDAVDSEQTASGTTWVDVAYVNGTYDRDTSTLTVTAAREATPEDYPPLVAQDFSVPCEPPDGGWPARNQEWPADDVRTIPGYGGMWTDDSQQVVVVAFTGDLDAAEAAVRQYYGDALCVVPAQHTEEELYAIQTQLDSMSSIQFLSTAVYVDATGGWVEAQVIAQDPDRQAGFDDTFGAGTVRLVPALREMSPERQSQERVPPVVGLTEGQARNVLGNAGFLLEVQYIELPAGDSEDGLVRDQSVEPSELAERGSVITVTIGQSSVVSAG